MINLTSKLLIPLPASFGSNINFNYMGWFKGNEII